MVKLFQGTRFRRRTSVFFVFGMLIFVVACANVELSPMDITGLQPRPPTKKGVVFVFPGFTPPGDNFLRSGMARLTNELQAKGVSAFINNASRVHEVSAEFLASKMPDGSRPPVAVIGYSLGADAAIVFCDDLNARGVIVQTLVLLEATSPTPVPANVIRALHLKGTGFFTFGREVRPGDGFHGSIENRELDIDEQGGRFDHWSISKSQEVYLQITREVMDDKGVRVR